MLRRFSLVVLVACLTGCVFFLALARGAWAQDSTYTAPLILELDIPGVSEPVTVTVQIAVSLPRTGSAAPASSVAVTATQANSSSGAVKVLSLQPAERVVGGPGIVLTPGAEPVLTILATPTPQSAAGSAAAPEPTAVLLQGTVNSSANLRTGPGTTYAVAGKAEAGDSVTLAGKSNDDAWYKLDDGAWIAAFLVDAPEAGVLAVLGAPSEAESWPRYEMISGVFSFAYPPQLAVEDEAFDSVKLSQGSAYGPSLGVTQINGEVQIDPANPDELIRALKGILTAAENFNYRFLGEGVLDTKIPSVYVTGMLGEDSVDFEIGFAVAWASIGSHIVQFHYMHYGSPDITKEAVSILTEMVNSIEASSPAADPPAGASTPQAEAASDQMHTVDLVSSGGASGAAAGKSQSQGSLQISAPPAGATNAAALNQYMVGNALVSLPPPAGADLEVIELGRTDDTLHVLVRNNTDSPIEGVSVDTVARGADGSMLAVEESLGSFEPNLVNPGQVTYGIVFFSDLTFPDGVKFSHEVKSSAAAQGQTYGDLVVAEVNLVGNRFVGMLRNDTSKRIKGTIEAVALCFDQQGNFLFDSSESTLKDEVEAGGSIPFQIAIRDSCPRYIVFASGFHYQY